MVSSGPRPIKCRGVFFFDFLVNPDHTNDRCPRLLPRVRALAMKQFLCGALALGMLVSRAAQTKADYIFTTLDGVLARGINDSGDIVGWYELSGSYLYSGGSYTPINVPGFSTLACGINNARQIVGYSGGADGFLLSGGSYTRIDVPGSLLTFAYGINNAGQIVGTFKGPNSDVPDMGFLLDGGNFSTILRPGASYTRVVAINDPGQILGDNFLLSQDKYTTIRYPGAVDSYAEGINNAGQIVGGYDDRTGAHGFILSDGVYSSIDFPGAMSTAVGGINNLGQIVGAYTDAAGNSHAFLATPVPEPSNIVLLGLGSVGLIYWMCRHLFITSRGLCVNPRARRGWHPQQRDKCRSLPTAAR
jgi:probable HAF family extracellular repeat protein